jgi:predicted  nucleic acid-binding Zn-ribbon protein
LIRITACRRATAYVGRVVARAAHLSRTRVTTCRKDLAMSTRDQYVETLKAQLDKWNAEISALEERSAQARADIKAQYEKQLAGLHTRQSEAKTQLDAFRHASEDAWSELRAGMEKAWADLGEAVKAASARLK